MLAVPKGQELWSLLDIQVKQFLFLDKGYQCRSGFICLQRRNQATLLQDSSSRHGKSAIDHTTTGGRSIKQKNNIKVHNFEKVNQADKILSEENHPHDANNWRLKILRSRQAFSNSCLRLSSCCSCAHWRSQQVPRNSTCKKNLGLHLSNTILII